MRKSFDIAIIGGGVIGLALACALRREKARVAVIDAAADIPPATDAAAGMLAPSFEVRDGNMADTLYAFGAQNLEMWPAFAASVEEEAGASIDFRDDGTLGVAFDDVQAGALQASIPPLAALGARAEMISGDEARRLEPALSPSVAAALLAPDDAQVDPRKLLAALRRIVAETAGPIIAARLEKAEKQNRAYGLVLSNGERLAADTLVLASGAAATAGLIEDIEPPPVAPAKGEALALAMPYGLIRRVVRAPGAYLCPKADGRLVIGATEYRGRDDLTVDDAAIAGLRRGAAAAAPATAELPEGERWAGLRPATPDAAPILGRDPRGPENVFFALGHHRNGVLLAPATAKALAREITGGAPVTDLKPFAPDRFETAGHG